MENSNTTDRIENHKETPFIFTGKGGEYFCIWIVNIILTIITLGIYSAWAKVRNHQYFYGNTQLDGASFIYTANPVHILKGRLIGFGFLVIYFVLTTLLPLTVLPFSILFLLLFPWLVCSAARFNARNSEYRNVRFNFTGTYWPAFIAIYLWPLAGILSLGILFPYSMYKQQEFYMKHYQYGDASFEFKPRVWDYYKYSLILLGFAAVFFLIMGLMMASMGVSLQAVDGASPDAAKTMMKAIGPMYLMGLVFYFWIFAYASVKMANLVFNATHLKSHGFNASLQVGSYMWLVFSNALMIIFSIGLLYPVTKVRMARYKAEHVMVLVDGDLNQFSESQRQKAESVGTGIDDVFDIDVGGAF